jgi:hypothetical protein
LQSVVHLGFEVGSGRPVEIPLKHMAICGQTQEAGKTTALEALITRAGVRAVTFITKRGEGSFTDARRIDPYFREQADWQFVASILEASRGEKLKFERAWIIRASKGARTLADVHRNVRRAMETAKGLAGDVYLTLDAYLEAVVPQIGRVRWAPRVELAAGVNAMDLTALSTEMMHLVIKSTIDWILEREHDTVIVVPEAWRFIPQGRGTPVKLSAAAFIRQGAALRNYLWLDSQDLGGIEKEILRSVPLWILGVQREANEIKRTLANIPASIAKPKASDIATLELGQFYGCWGKHAVKTYVQPAWMNAAQARQVADGSLDLAIAAKLSPPVGPQTIRTKEDKVDAAEAQTLREDNARLTRENEDLRRRLERLEGTERHRRDDRATRTDLPESHDAGRRAGVRAAPTRTADAQSGTTSAVGSPIDDGVYQHLLARLVNEAANDPRLLKVLTQRPELEVHVQRQVIEVDGDTLRGRIARLLADGLFEEAQTTSSVMGELSKRGFNTAPPNVSKELGELARMGFLTRDNKWYRVVPEMKVNIIEAA